jgi:hypothetical protein
MPRCPISNSDAEEIDRGLFDGVGFECKFHRRSGSLALFWVREGAHPQTMGARAVAKARVSHARPCQLGAVVKRAAPLGPKGDTVFLQQQII